MDLFLLILAFILLLAGVIGAFIPILPGPPLSFAGMLLIHFTSLTDFSGRILLTFGIITLLITIADYLLPIWGTRLGKGTRHGMFGATIGLIIGIFFFPPFGILIGPIAGAWLAERVNGKNNEDALRSAIGSFFGLLLGVVLKFTVSVAIIWYVLYGLFVSVSASS
ncbi:MAG: DUF456 domain-containing protein [Bacteroidetes bacterium]|nr:MAG: DUF456 domain-containing protein [Bacteroidota bacterium]